MRKAMLPIRPDYITLDVGSGANPHPCADVLLDKFVNTSHRHGVQLTIDRPFVLGDACKMPFKDKAFDFVIAFHVLEHMQDPAAFLKELQRVSKRGYIETPNALFERLIPYDVHCLEVMKINGRLIIRKKESARPDTFLYSLKVLDNLGNWRKFFYSNPDFFHTRYNWEGTIDFEVVNPQTDCSWINKVDKAPESNVPGLAEVPDSSFNLRSMGLRLMRRYYAMRPKKLDLDSLLACPDCHSPLLKERDFFVCATCQMKFRAVPVPDFNEKFPV